MISIYLKDYDYYNQNIYNRDTNDLIGKVVKLNANPGEYKWQAFLPGMVSINIQGGDTPAEAAQHFVNYINK